MGGQDTASSCGHGLLDGEERVFVVNSVPLVGNMVGLVFETVDVRRQECLERGSVCRGYFSKYAESWALERRELILGNQGIWMG